MKTETEIAVMQPQAKEQLEPPEAGRVKEASSSRSCRGNVTRSFQTSGIWNCEKMSFCCFKPPGLCGSPRRLEQRDRFPERILKDDV